MSERTRGELILYESPEGKVRVEVHHEDETFWLSQRQMADLFGVDVRTINEHLGNIYASGELAEEATIRNFRIVRQEGHRSVAREIAHHNLDAIISVGYRVNSAQATRFRIWATNTLREFIVKGFVLDDERLKLNQRFGKDKLHWAVTGKTSAEIIAGRADAGQPAMGLTTWKNAPRGKVVKSDVSVAKNYLVETEIKELERIVSMYLDYAENQAARQLPMKMTDWVQKLDAFLAFNEYEVLGNAGGMTAAVARRLAEDEYAEFRVVQDRVFESDFEREVKRIRRKVD